MGAGLTEELLIDIAGRNASLDVTIPNGGAIMAAGVDLGRKRLAAIIMSVGWTAGAITFEASDAVGGIYRPIYDKAGTERSITVSAARFVALDLADFIAIRFLKLRSGTVGTPVNQAADRVLTLVLA